ncbi:MAG TPA: ABC transporter ATP-binding protein, partial [Chloroflexi bacterium]|nr:ABC transporter ATP-binding protein [Chloroflexota bacterium]
EFWALKDVSFEVKRGEVVGVIGRNGAGKSTLLKILSRITEPTTGHAEIHGRVGSLLEVGTGFHPELTGRENIYLNGAILGMKRTEIARKFDEIVAFSEIEKFLDTPVKRYSSGMYVRLAFAVAAHLEPEILLVDEVLAVGDASFQKKCLGKMGDIAGEGRTVLFVSHNMAAVQSLCSKALLLVHGQIDAIGDVDSVIQGYLCSGNNFNSNSRTLVFHEGRSTQSSGVLQEISLSTDNQPTSVLKMGGKLTIQVKYTLTNNKNRHNLRLGIAIENYLGIRVMNFSPSDQQPDLLQMATYKGVITCEIPELCLTPGLYFITLTIGNSIGDLDRVERAIQFNVEPSDIFGTAYNSTPNQGFFYQRANWSLTNLSK